MDFNRAFKNMPKGTVLYSPIIGECKFECFDDSNNIIVSFIDENGIKRHPVFNGHFGFLKDCSHGKVMLFPDKEETWDNWQSILFKKGDFITNGCGCVEIYLTTNSCINSNGKIIPINRLKDYTYASDIGINDFKGTLKLNGYKWDNTKNELEHIVEKPKFKIGETIRPVGANALYTIVDITDTTYVLDDNTFVYIYEQEKYVHVRYSPIFKVGDLIKEKESGLHYIVDRITDSCYILRNNTNTLLFEFQYDWEVVYGETESYCNYKNCKKLVEHGFKYKGDLSDNLDKYGFYSGPNHIVVFDDYVVSDEDCIRISQDSAMKWIRKVYGLEIGAKPVMDCDANETVYIPFVKRYNSSRKEYVNEISYLEAIACEKYEDAINDAITYSFKKLI